MTNLTRNFSTNKRKVSAIICAGTIAVFAARAASAQAPANAPKAPAAPAPFYESPQSVLDKSNPNLPIVRFEATNLGDIEIGDKLALPRQIAAVVVAMDNPSPKYIVDVGSHQGEFLEAFLDRFPAARGQWTEPVDTSEALAKKRFARFGDRVNYRIGCPGRDISDGCVPKTADVIITAWVSAHRDPQGVAKYYHDAAAQLPVGGWLVNLDHVSVDSNWEHVYEQGKLYYHLPKEGPVAHGEHAVATLEQHLAALKAAGIQDPQVIWRSFDVVLIMGKKR